MAKAGANGARLRRSYLVHPEVNAVLGWKNAANKRVYGAFEGAVECSRRDTPHDLTSWRHVQHSLKGPLLPQKCFGIEQIGDQFC